MSERKGKREEQKRCQRREGGFQLMLIRLPQRLCLL